MRRVFLYLTTCLLFFPASASALTLSDAQPLMLVSNAYPELAGVLNAAIDDITPQEPKSIFEYWLPVKYERGFDWPFFWSVVGLILFFSSVIITLFGVWNRRLRKEIKRRKKAEQDLRAIAMCDPLTKLANRNRFSEDFTATLSLCERQGSLMALALLDLDNFKPINDRYGHLVGDMCLKEIALRIQSQCRASDTVARLGGDEFAVIFACPEDEMSLVIVAERLIRALNEPIYVKDLTFMLGYPSGFPFTLPWPGNE